MADYSGAYGNGFISTPSMSDINSLKDEVEELKKQLAALKTKAGESDAAAPFDVIVTKKYWYTIFAGSEAEAKAIFLDKEDELVPSEEDMIDIEVELQ